MHNVTVHTTAVSRQKRPDFPIGSCKIIRRRFTIERRLMSVYVLLLLRGVVPRVLKKKDLPVYILCIKLTNRVSVIIRRRRLSLAYV